MMSRRGLVILASLGFSIFAWVVLYTVSIGPFTFANGVLWFEHGPHYLSPTDVSNRIANINAPKVEQVRQHIEASTPACSDVSGGFCQKSPSVYVEKQLVEPAVQYQPGTPDRKEIVGYCTLCNDGSMSPSCAVGRGACSWHGGVAAYNVAEYVTIPGTPEVKAQPAVYTYIPETYKDSPDYFEPSQPTMEAIVSY